MTDVVVEVVERAEDVIVEVGTRGKPGEPGRDGVDGGNGQDGQDGAPGADGRDGGDGQDGVDGRDADDGRDGADGQPGETGDKGDPGGDGQDGRDGADGQNGQNGADGQPGGRGQQGEPGRDGVDGAPGQDGQDGAPGADGADGQEGADGRKGDTGDVGPDGTTEWAGLTDKPTIYSEFAIWAEERADLADSTYNWAFGNGANTPSGAGITLPFDCELFALTLTLYGAASCVVEARKNADGIGRNVTTSNSASGVNNFADSSVAFAAGDRINFHTVTGSPDSNSAVVAAWFRRAVA